MAVSDDKPGRTAEEFKSQFNPDQEVLHLRERVAQLEKKLNQEKKATGEARLNTIELAEAIETASPAAMKFVPHKSDRSPNTFVVQLTDLHMGEIINADEIDGFGEFSPEIFHDRMEALGNRVIHEVETQRASYNIPNLHILGTGDYISGDIHHELQVTNAFPTAVQSVRSGYEIGAFISMLSPYFEKVTADLLTLDNHGRMTRRNQAAQGGENNWGYVVAHIVEQYCSELENVEVIIHAKPSALVEIGSERYLCFHGHQIKGWAGLPYYGFDRRIAMEAVKRMGMPDVHFTKMVMGHFHVAVDAPHWLIGGSLSGTNAFDHSQGRHSQAHQTSWLVHPTHGQFNFTRWFL